jgi:exodeoxyribonuclease VII large subunit
MSAIAFGRVSVFPRDGAYQLYVDELKPDGVGDLYYAFEQLKEKLFKEGLFDESLKKPLPNFPKKIAVITSPVGAAVQDIIRILGTRWPLAKVVILPVRVQGEEAPGEISAAISYANITEIADIIITGRGGGSIEDLWAFNDERVARAIFASKIPIISAVGHEPDITIADFVADIRAATPSNAAEIATPDINEIRDILGGYEIRQRQAVSRELKLLRGWLSKITEKRVMQNPLNYFDDKRLYIDHSQDRLIAAARRKISASREAHTRLKASLEAMDPLKVLGRGYAIAQKEDGTIIKDAKGVKPGDKIIVRFKKDNIKCAVE